MQGRSDGIVTTPTRRTPGKAADKVFLDRAPKGSLRTGSHVWSSPRRRLFAPRPTQRSLPSRLLLHVPRSAAPRGLPRHPADQLRQYLLADRRERPLLDPGTNGGPALHRRPVPVRAGRATRSGGLPLQPGAPLASGARQGPGRPRRRILSSGSGGPRLGRASRRGRRAIPAGLGL